MAGRFSFFEFFAGGGMARAGLGENWECQFANDLDPMKAATYCDNWGKQDFVLADVAKVTVDDLPGRPDLVWASFPCQDLSLAGSYRGLGDSENLTRSGTFWPFWSLITKLVSDLRKPKIIVLENVAGAITSRNGADFRAICDAVAKGGYFVGAFLADARHFVPQSRPRLFFVAVDDTSRIGSEFISKSADPAWHSSALCAAQSSLTGKAADNWVWWRLPSPPIRNTVLADLIEAQPNGCKWHTEFETDRLLALMNPLHKAKIEQAKLFALFRFPAAS